MSRRREQPSAADEHGQIAFAEAMADRTVAIIARPLGKPPEEEALGSGICLTYSGEYLVLTAAHVVEKCGPGDIDFLARPKAPLTRNPARLVTSARFHPPIAEIVMSPGGQDGPDDLAVLRLSGRPPEMEHVEFYVARPDEPIPAIRRSVGIFGFPFESSRVVRKGSAVGRAVMPYYDFPPRARMTRSAIRALILGNESYRPNRQVLLSFPDRPVLNAEGHLHDPSGLSGCGAWKVSPRKDTGLWLPVDAKPVAIIIGYNRKLGVLAGTRIKRAWELLRRCARRRQSP